jgi:(4-(4-[2-(gamma-L-glutamylamino)ethyl]phenoxymethyl)furan-2-yl)methanamine synthase
MPQAHSDSRDVIALDIGGAAIKAADGVGWTRAEPFAMWREWERLPAALAAIIGSRGRHAVVATMTGEIADCFADRPAGVSRIVGALEAAASACGCPAPQYYRTDGRLVAAAEALAEPLAVAASNWHAVARLAAELGGAARGVVIDVGSTTTDIVPVADGRPVPRAFSDAGRMASGELVYTGVERTPLPAIVRRLPHGPLLRPVASERFAESRDAWLLLGALDESPTSRDTADAAPFTCAASRVRLARSILVEPAEFSPAAAARAAAWVAEVQARQVARSIDRVVRACGWRPEVIVFSGHGERLARMAVDRLGWQVERVSLPDRLGRDVSRSAPAHALALIALGDLP